VTKGSKQNPQKWSCTRSTDDEKRGNFSRKSISQQLQFSIISHNHNEKEKKRKKGKEFFCVCVRKEK